MKNNESKKVVTRFAPSPTGYMHIGGVRTALFAWAFARKHGGTFILRIEDTDKEREVEGSIDQIIESLSWLGITWDEGVNVGGPAGEYLQSKRLESYIKYAKILEEKGLAYADPYSSEEIEIFRQKAEAEKRPFLYRDHRPDNPLKWDGTQPLRLKITEIKTTEWEDAVRGKLSAGPEALDDFILIKSDGYPTYNLAHIIDDFEMNVTHILRADEFISSVPKYLALYKALEIEPPIMATLPPIMSPDGKKKLGKRDGAKDILGYRDEGYLPSAMLNFLVFIGWNPGDETEILTASEFIERFDLSKVQRSGGSFNEEKLNWLNKEHLKLLSKKDQLDFVLRFLSAEFVKEACECKIEKLLPVIIDRISYGKQISEMEEKKELNFVILEPELELSVLNWNDKQKSEITAEHLNALNKIISEISANEISTEKPEKSVEFIKSKIMEYANDFQQRGGVLHPLRYALTGLANSPDPFSVIYILGKEESQKRLLSAVNLLQA